MCGNGENPRNFDSFRKQFLRHLSENYDVTAISKDFGALNSNRDRVDFVFELLNSSKIDIPFQNGTKSDTTAVQLREQGNQLFKTKKLKEAWELYTKSLGHAEESVNLALAYANRSAVLFEANLQQECLKDIERALKHDYPEHLQPKLFLREKKARALKEFTKHHEGVPTVAAKNPTIECASTSVEIKEDQDFGRFVVATRDIKVGEILAVEQPFASLLVNQYLSHCHNCLTLCYCLVPCQNCTHTLYCSESCKTTAFQQYHRHECPILPTLHLLEFDKLKLLPLRIALSVTNLDHLDEQYRSDRYAEIHNLVTNTSKRSISDLFERSTAAATIFTLVKTHTSFFDTGNAEFFKEVLLLHMQTGPSNFHEITELSAGPLEVYQPEEVASGAFAFLSLLNHSCCPNVCRFCHGGTIVLRAIQNVKKGEQLFDNYGYHYAVMGRFERQKHLKSQYYFECSCEACRNDWGLYDELPSGGNFEVDEDLMRKLSVGDVETNEVLLQETVDKLGELQNLQPCRSFCKVQEVLKQFFAALGNKRRLF